MTIKIDKALITERLLSHGLVDESTAFPIDKMKTLVEVLAGFNLRVMNEDYIPLFTKDRGAVSLPLVHRVTREPTSNMVTITWTPDPEASKDARYLRINVAL